MFASPPPRIGSETVKRVCAAPLCDTAFQPSRTWNVYCSDTCARRARRWRGRGRQTKQYRTVLEHTDEPLAELRERAVHELVLAVLDASLPDPKLADLAGWVVAADRRLAAGR